MKQPFLMVLLGLFITALVTAQEYKPRKKYLNLSYSTQTLSMPDEADFKLKSNYGAAFTVGHTYFVHKKPIANMIRFGIDATWIDLNYGNYSIEEEDSYDGEVETYTSQFHQAEVAMQVGPSITVTPLKRLNAHLYFRYAPSFSLLYLDESLMGNYATFFVTGGRITYGAIGLGIEARFGKANYKEFGAGDEADYDYDGDYDEEQSSIANKLKTSGMRVYLSFRF